MLQGNNKDTVLTSQSLSLMAHAGHPGGRFWGGGGGGGGMSRLTDPSPSVLTGTMSTTWVPCPSSAPSTVPTEQINDKLP